MNMKVEIRKSDIVEGQTDDRGRIYLGSEYADKTVEVAVLDVIDGEDGEA